ncbi:hypothetical protein GGR57DRAFT_426859 [Xylariaceae sp. FL1272]|nr:hypothetical protein GGR57DRAFT_426859 [Xylariaceae sp. FL1272]
MDIAKNYSLTTTIGGWAFLILAGGVIYYRLQSKNRRPQIIKHAPRQSESAASGDSKKKAEKAAKPKPKPQTPSTNTSQPVAPAIDYDAEQEEASEKKAAREFAKQMQKAVTGTKVNTKKSDEKRQKSVKQSKAQEKVEEAVPDKLSAPSSTTGDADDDLSPQVSPAFAAADNQGGVADMLEPVASGPSVLRLTDTDSAKKPQQRQAKALQPVETKKQRQNRKKAEAAKAAREEEEKDRKVLMEQQRRTARVAEGRAAKDGSAFTAAQSAWNNKPTNGSTSVQLLDTMEPPRSVKPAAAAPAAPADAYVNLPSEEEQLEMIRAEDSWSEVKTKKKGKKKETSAPVPTASTPVASSTKPVNGAKKPVLTSSSSSFAALTSEDIADEEEVEQEWDV